MHARLSYLLVCVLLTAPFPGLENGLLAQMVNTEYNFTAGGGKVSLTTRILVEEGQAYTVDNILRGETGDQFRAPDKGVILDGGYVWQQLALVNEGNETQKHLFLLNARADSVWVQTVDEEGVVSDRESWFVGESPRAEYVFLPSHTIGITLNAGEQRTLLCRLYFREAWPESSVARLTIAESRWLVDNKFGLMAWHAFYSGLMIAISLISLLNYRLFRNVAFVYFSLVTLSFAGYFLEINNLLQLIGIPRVNGSFVTVGLFISSSIIWLTFFGLSYAEVKRRFPRYFYVIVFATTLVVAAQFLPLHLGVHITISVALANSSLLLWVVVIIAPLGILAYRGDRLARRLLQASVVLATPAVIYIASLLFSSNANIYLQLAVELGTLGFSALFFTTLFKDVSEIRNLARAEREEHLVKSRFFANISHEFRTPLTLIMGSIDHLLRRHPPGTEDRQLLELAQVNATRQLSLVNRVLQLSRLEASEGELSPETIDLYGLVYQAVESFEALANQGDIDLKFICHLEQLTVVADYARIEEALFNLLSNALKFTPAEGEVTVTLKLTAGEAVIAVSDTGVGIRKELLPNVFDRFFQSEVGKEQGQRGSGLGLSLVREMVRLHGGRVFAESELHQGSTFTLTLPLGNVDHGTVRQTASQNRASAETRQSILPVTITSDPSPEGPTVLIVEDNQELRGFIRFSLQHDFRIVEAQNGTEGIEMAVRLQPDLIISDVMMPYKDGYELCGAVKSNIETSHIPVILLTAKTSAKSRIIGLNHGADDYLTKPFNDRELIARVHNLIQLRQLLRQRYASSIELKPSELASNDLDAQFLQDAMDIMERKLADDSFRVADFARELGMSSASLNRKLRALLDQSTNQFIRSVRLQRAHDLLGARSHSVTEVAHLAGFSSSAYFVKSYKEKYGYTPGTLLKNEEG